MQLQRIQLGLTVDVATTHTTKPVVQTGDDKDRILTKCKPAEQSVENGVVIRPSVKVVRTNSEGGKNVTSPIEERRHSTGKKITSPVEENGPVGGGRKYSHDKNWRRSAGGLGRDDNKNDDIWGTPRGDKSVVWGHDDRFTKDDDFYGKQAQRGEGTSRPRNRESTNWRERKGSDGGKEQKSAEKPKNDKTKVEEKLVGAPPLPDEENWD